MVLTKKRLAILSVFLAAIYFVLFMTFSEQLGGNRGDGPILHASKSAFLSLSAAMATCVVIMLFLKKEFIRWQIFSFNRFKYLLMMRVKRDFIARYRKSVLGVLWSLLNPLLTMLIMTLIFSTIFAHAIPNFPVYLFSGLVIFNFFSESTSQSMGSIIGSEGIIRRIYIPKYIFPLTRVISSLINMAFAILAMFIVVVATGAPFHWTMLLIPIPIFFTFVFALGVSLMLSALAVYFRDLTYLWGVILTLLQFMSALFWPIEILPPGIRPFIGLNPIFQFISYMRSLVLDGVVPDLWTNLVCASLALVSLCVGTYVFMTKQERFILYM